MQAIGGFIRLDRAAVREPTLRHLASRLCPNPAIVSDHDTNLHEHTGFVQAHWGGTAPVPQTAMASEPASGCRVVADARLEQTRNLARELRLPPSQPPPGDAALILRAWLRWGTSCARHLRGDFAFVLWDSRQQLVYCARDILGVRPLHLHHQPGRLLAFATRAAALAALPEVPDNLDEGRIADALAPALESIDKTSTFFRDIKRLPPAHWATFDARGQQQQCYWQPQPGRVAVPRGDHAWAEAFTQALEAAVAAHLDSAGRVGCMLSGGLDSTPLAVLAADQLRHSSRGPLPTFSRVDEDPTCPETRAIRAMLDYPGFDPVVIDDARLQAMRDGLLHATMHSDEPFDANMTLLHTQYMAASEAGVDALMDGIDGDILLSEGSTLLRQLRRGRWPAAWRNIRGLQKVSPGFSAWRYFLLLSRGAFVPEALRRRLRPDRLAQQARVAIENNLLAPDFARRVDLPSRFERLATWSSNAYKHDTARQAAWTLQHANTTNGMERYHRVAAWHGVQPRHPLTHRALLDLCVNLPDRQRLAHGWTKLVVRHAMHGRLPDAVCWRRGKQHLGANLNRRLLLADTEAVCRELHQQRDDLAPYVDLARLEQRIQRARQATDPAPELERLMSILSLGRWLARRHQPMGRTAAA